MTAETSTFKCENCQEVFKKINNEMWNDARAFEELQKLEPGCQLEDTFSTCYECYKIIMGEFASLTPVEKALLREEYYRKKSGNT